MKDILGRELKVGDIVAHGTRSGNSGDLNIKIIADIKKVNENRHGVQRETKKYKVINYNHISREWDKDINESVPEDLKKFLKSLV